MSTQFDTLPSSIEEELGMSSAQAELLGAMIIEDEEQALFSAPTGDKDATAHNDDQDDTTEDTSDDEHDEEDDQKDNSLEYADEDQLVTLPDGTEISVHELIRGNLRDADYRHKTMELADERREVAGERDQLNEIATTTANERIWMAQLLQSHMPKMPDRALAQQNPAMYNQAMAAYAHAKQNMEHSWNQLAQNHTAAFEASQAQIERETEQQQAEILAGEFDAMIKDNPEFEDPEKFDAFKQDALAHFQSYGFAPEEIEGVADHRFIKVMRDAIAYQELKAAKPEALKKLKGRPPVMSSKARKSGSSRRSKAVKERISKATHMGDAQSVSDILGTLLES